MAKPPSRDAYLLKNYGITEAEFNRLLAVRDGACWICGKMPKSRLNVDHDHRDAKALGLRLSVRGLLCWACNKMVIGRQHREHAAMYRAAAAYLESDLAQEILNDRVGTHHHHSGRDCAPLGHP